MILVIDNYDSFTFNLVHYLQELGANIRIVRNDALSVEDAMAMGPAGVLISPGPKTPDDAGITLPMVAACAAARVPLLGVCLGHQAIGQHFGGRVVRGGLMHGKVSPITHDGTGVFAGLPSPYNATRYHSLVVTDVPETLIVNATVPSSTDGDALVMGFRHRDLPIHGVQFHPESIATQYGHALLANFVRMTGTEPRTVTPSQALSSNAA